MAPLNITLLSKILYIFNIFSLFTNQMYDENCSKTLKLYSLKTTDPFFSVPFSKISTL